MMKRTLLTAFAVTAVASAFAQSGMMMDVDAKMSKPKELAAFVNMDAYKKLSAPDAYILTDFLTNLPGNYQTALLRGLAQNAMDAKMLRMKNQDAANMMAPMGDMMPPMMPSGYKNMQQGERSFEMVAMDPLARISYLDTLKILETGQDETDRGLIDSLFAPKSFVRDPLLSPWNERQLDAVERYIKANAMSTMPYHLKYTSLAPHVYAGLPSDWASKPWPAGS